MDEQDTNKKHIHAKCICTAFITSLNNIVFKTMLVILQLYATLHVKVVECVKKEKRKTTVIVWKVMKEQLAMNSLPFVSSVSMTQYREDLKIEMSPAEMG